MAVMPPQVPRCEELSSSRFSNREMVAWAAGLFEGEGSIHRNNGKYWQAALTSTDETVVRQFRAVLGVGKIYGPTWGKRSTKPYWTWVVSDKRGLETVWGLIGPFLHERRRVLFERMIMESEGRRRNGTWSKRPKAEAAS